MQFDIFIEEYDYFLVDDFLRYAAYSLALPNDIHVSVYDADDGEKAMGYIIKLSPRSYEIHIRDGLNKFELLETLAHELAHILDTPKLTYRENNELAEIKGREIASRYLEITDE